MDGPHTPGLAAAARPLQRPRARALDAAGALWRSSALRQPRGHCRGLRQERRARAALPARCAPWPRFRGGRLHLGRARRGKPPATLLPGDPRQRGHQPHGPQQRGFLCHRRALPAILGAGSGLAASRRRPCALPGGCKHRQDPQPRHPRGGRGRRLRHQLQEACAARRLRGAQRLLPEHRRGKDLRGSGALGALAGRRWRSQGGGLRARLGASRSREALAAAGHGCGAGPAEGPARRRGGRRLRGGPRGVQHGGGPGRAPVGGRPLGGAGDRPRRPQRQAPPQPKHGGRPHRLRGHGRPPADRRVWRRGLGGGGLREGARGRLARGGLLLDGLQGPRRPRGHRGRPPSALAQRRVLLPRGGSGSGRARSASQSAGVGIRRRHVLGSSVPCMRASGGGRHRGGGGDGSQVDRSTFVPACVCALVSSLKCYCEYCEGLDRTL
mmetsp:Transcript_36325/g.113059  ORF Transcript_36325/g.113059 Transcript_36325/m.113059 type:complete len:440 (-) Transcript_36325:153-1472(-)